MGSATTKPVLVGIDGSEQAENAAVWATDEALHRGATLRLVYVIRTDLTGALTADEYRSALADAKVALKSATAAVSRTGKGVRVDTAIEQGSPAGVLLAECAAAEMICLGASGMGRVGQAMLGSTAATVAEKADCSVVIAPVRRGVAEDSTKSWVVVPVSVYTAHDSDVIEDAVGEARLREWSVLALGVRHDEFGATPVDSLDGIVFGWRQRFPDIHVYPVATDSGLRQFLRANPDVGGLVVLDETAARETPAIVGSEHRAGRHAERAVLIVRHRTSRSLAELDSSRC